MKARIIITTACTHDCEKCCNKQYKMSKLPLFLPEHDNKFDALIFTGGEPMMRTDRLWRLIVNINFIKPMYLYTALPCTGNFASLIYRQLTGYTLSIHTQNDIENFLSNQRIIESDLRNTPSLRLNIEENVKIPPLDLSKWKVKIIQMVDSCPLPSDEVLMRLVDID